MKTINIGLCGLGTVGGGVYTVLKRNADLISARAGSNILVSLIGTRSFNPHCDIASTKISDDVLQVAEDPSIDIVVELIGGTSVAFDLIMSAIRNRKHVVTANKALIAERGEEIFLEAEKNQVVVAFEAAVAGGIPIIKALREGLVANDIHWMAGIINGTSNFILSEMASKKRKFHDVLEEAKEKGYAEADPTFDVDGTDAAQKLAILASIAFSIPLNTKNIYKDGITHLQLRDIAYASELGYVVKHLGIARQKPTGIELRVHPALVPESCLLSSVDDVLNAIMVDCDALGSTLFYGRGAGSEPTASSIIADIIDISRIVTSSTPSRIRPLGIKLADIKDKKILSIEQIETCYYLRFSMHDTPGVLSKATTIMAEVGISIEAIIQKEEPLGIDYVDVIVITKSITELHLNLALKKIQQLDTVEGDAVIIRLERLDQV
ncbi:MAG: homoserine dehydrogenase [Cellvibrionales bacterium TMED49]|nr:homoserine dehydrogenase [Porticoccaceae bacterium]OUU38502.1 MAG: homoserine dehydrogenase [Cellvibrionales bacterium TMED49]